MKLASVADIRDDLGFDDMTDINDAITGALDAADAELQSLLATDFEAATRTDYFFVDRASNGGPPSTELRLSTGLVTSIIQILQGSDVEALEDYPQAQQVQTSTFTLDGPRGVLKDIRTRYVGAYIRVDYVAGLPVDPTDPSSYDLSKVPAWLQQVAKLKVKLLLADSDSFKQANITVDTRLTSSQVFTALSRMSRYTPCARLPL